MGRMATDDDAAAAFYADPANREVTGPSRKRQGQPASLTTQVPVRFTASFVERVKMIAHAEGMTVSSWIRRTVARELERYIREHARDSAVIPGSGRLVAPRHIPSSLSYRPATGITMGQGGGTASCPHLSVASVTAASCGICGPLAVTRMAS